MRLRRVWQVEFSSLRWRVLCFSLLARLVPKGRGFPIRSAFIRAMGISVGAGTRFFDLPMLQSAPPGSLKNRLRVGVGCVIGANVILEFGEAVMIGDRTTLANGVVVLTTTHQLGPSEHRAGVVVRKPVVVGSNVSIGENAIILPGAVIGDGAQIIAGSVVSSRVAPLATVSGIPARPQRVTHPA